MVETVLEACEAARPGTCAALRGWVCNLQHVAVMWHEAWLAWMQQSLVRTTHAVAMIGM